MYSVLHIPDKCVWIIYNGAWSTLDLTEDRDGLNESTPNEQGDL